MATYTVKSGDTLGKLAKRFDTTVADIQAANKITDINLIRRGQKLQIPSLRPPNLQADAGGDKYGEVYIVRKGETLSRIAASQGVGVGDILAHNPTITDPNLIKIGQLIAVPNSIKSSPANVAQVVAPATNGDPLWLAFARKELASDIAEVKGTRHNPKILEYHATTTLRANQDETPWCSSFVNWCVTQADRKGTNRANARSWLSWGQPLTQPKKGAVAVFWRGKSNDGRTGHVGFFLEDNGSTVKLLGGNQGDRVSIKSQSMKKFLGFRYPK